MKVSAVLVTCLAVVSAQFEMDDIELCENLFRSILAVDGMKMEDDEFDYRLGIFTANVLDDKDLDGDDEPGRTKELFDMNHGAGIDASMEEEMLEMRRRGDSEEHFSLEKRAPPAYDSTRSVRMNDVVSQGVCGNCYMHTFVAALEIAYAKQTGKLLKFSEQEMTDCYYKGCHGGDFRSVAKTMAINDHLALKSKYGPYLNERDKNTRFTCKAAATPDALIDIKVVGVVDVTPATVNDAVSKYGSVMTCMDWSNQCVKIGKMYKGGVFAGPTVKDGCEHAVLIVGYTSTYYKVRNSHGKSFGENGYFRIQRGTNACGIEDQMAAIITEKRVSKPGLAPNGCPADKPNYCASTFVCASKACVSPGQEVEVEARDEEMVNEVEEEIVNEVEEVVVKKRHARDLSLLSAETEVVVKRGCAADKSGSCARYASRCSSSSIQRICATTCCGGAPAPAPKPKKVGEPKGACTVPTIANGRVMAGSSIPSGSTLRISCKPGYKLEGDDVTCLIQDVFGPDSRLLPECVKVGAEDLVGNGATYAGTKSTTVDGRTCMSWNKEVVQGYVPITAAQIPTYLLGNHNFCRNEGGVLTVPWCIVDTAGNTAFCFKYPGCEVCGGADTDKYCDEYARDCAYSRPDRMNRPNNAWDMCPATCCATAGC